MAKTSVFNINRNIMWIVQAVLSGHPVLITNRNYKEKQEDPESHIIKDLITKNGFRFSEAIDSNELELKSIDKFEFKENFEFEKNDIKSDFKIFQYKKDEIQFKGIDYEKSVVYEEKLVENIKEALTKRKFYKGDNFFDYLGECRQLEEKQQKEADKNTDSIERYSFIDEIKKPLSMFIKGKEDDLESIESLPIKVFTGLPVPPKDIIEKPEFIIAMNGSYKDIIEHSLIDENIIYISGPPGTGKTTVLRDIMINAFLEGKTVLFASKNNEAIESAFRKLTDFFNEISKGNPTLLPIPIIRYGNKKVQKISFEAITNNYFKRINHFLEFIDDNPIPEISGFFEYGNNPKKMNHKETIYNKLADRVRECVDELHSIEKLKDHEKWIDEESNSDFYSIVKKGKGSIDIFDLLYAFPIVFSTCDSVTKICSADTTIPFDIAIIDEASQCTITDGLLPALRTKSLILAGDMEQLRPVVMLDEKEDVKLRESKGIDNTYQYSTKSIQGCYEANDPYSNTIGRKFRLTNHFRCSPEIINFSNTRYYHGLNIHTEKESEDFPLRLVEITNDECNRETEVHVVMDEIKHVLYTELNGRIVVEKDVSILTPFREHADILFGMVTGSFPGVSVNTIHEFQGSENRVVILSLGLSYVDGTQINRDIVEKVYYQYLYRNNLIVNVAVTRAKEYFILVCNSSVLKTLSFSSRTKSKKAALNKTIKNEEKRALKYKQIDEERPDFAETNWVKPSYDDALALYLYMKNQCKATESYRSLDAQYPIKNEYPPVNSAEFVEYYINNMLSNNTYNRRYQEEEKYKAVRCRLKEERFTNDPAGEYICIKKRDDNESSTCAAFHVTNNPKESRAYYDKDNNNIDIIPVEKNSLFDYTLWEKVEHLIIPHELETGKQCYCSSAWYLEIFRTKKFCNGIPKTINNRNNQEFKNITYTFFSPDQSEIVFTWDDKYLMDVLYTFYRQVAIQKSKAQNHGKKIGKITDEKILQMLSGGESSRRSPKNKRKDNDDSYQSTQTLIDDAILRLSNTKVTITYYRKINEYNIEKITKFQKVPLLQIKLLKEHNFNIADYSLDEFLPLYSVAQERQEILSLDERYLISKLSNIADVSEKKAYSRHYPWRISRFLISTIKRYKNFDARKHNNSRLLYEIKNDIPTGLLFDIAPYRTSSKETIQYQTDHTLDFIDRLMKYYETQGDSIVSHEFIKTKDGKCYLFFEGGTRNFMPSKSDETKKNLFLIFQNYDPVKRNDYTAVKTIDKETVAQIVYRYYVLGESSIHIQNASKLSGLSLTQHSMNSTAEYTDINSSDINKIIDQYSNRLGNLIEQRIERDIFDSDLIIQDYIKLPKTKKWLTVLRPNPNKNKINILIKPNLQYPYIPEHCSHNSLTIVIKAVDSISDTSRVNKDVKKLDNIRIAVDWSNIRERTEEILSSLCISPKAETSIAKNTDEKIPSEKKEKIKLAKTLYSLINKITDDKIHLTDEEAEKIYREIEDCENSTPETFKDLRELLAFILGHMDENYSCIGDWFKNTLFIPPVNTAYQELDDLVKKMWIKPNNCWTLDVEKISYINDGNEKYIKLNHHFATYSAIITVQLLAEEYWKEHKTAIEVTKADFIKQKILDYIKKTISLLRNNINDIDQYLPQNLKM